MARLGVSTLILDTGKPIIERSDSRVSNLSGGQMRFRSSLLIYISGLQPSAALVDAYLGLLSPASTLAGDPIRPRLIYRRAVGPYVWRAGTN